MKFIRTRFARSLGTVLCTLMFLTPISASAQWVDPANLVQNLLQVLGQIKDYILQNSGYMKEYVLDIVQKGIATNIESRIMDSTMEWARTGFDGQPSFVSNPTDLVLNSEWNEAELFMDQLNGMIDEVCTPYRGDVLRKVALSAQDRRNASSNDRRHTLRLTQCDLDQAVSSGVIDNYFAEGGYEREGGMEPLIRVMTQRNNNPYEIAAVLVDIQNARQAKAVAEAKGEVFGGTIPNKECDVPGPNGSCRHYITKTPASNVSDFISKAVGHSLDEISGQDEISESIFARIISAYTDGVIRRGLAN